MNKLFWISLLFASIFITVACNEENTPNIDNPNVESRQIDSTLKNFYLKPTPTSTFETIYNTSFLVANCSFDINLWWYDPAATNGIYLCFTNSVGDVLIDSNGFIKAFDSGIKIDSTLSGSWSGSQNGVFSYDYISNPSANKGNLAGQGDKYIVFRAFTQNEPQLKYYGWLRVQVSENGRSLKVISIGYQKNGNTSLYTGEL